MRNFLLGVFLVGQIFSSQAQAALVTYFGVDQLPHNAVDLTKSPALARADFLAQISNTQTETFQELSQQPIHPTIPLAFPGNSATLKLSSMTGVNLIDGLNGAGRFATSGTHFLNVADPFSVIFSNPVNAFGFYGTDIGDFGGQLTVSITKTDGTKINLVIPNTIGNADGSLLFFGFTDLTDSYKSISIGSTASADSFGIDDMTIGEVIRPTTVPEPNTLLLAAFGMLALFAASRKITKQ